MNSKNRTHRKTSLKEDQRKEAAKRRIASEVREGWNWCR